MRVVLDTNVFVSAVLGRTLAPLLEAWQSGRYKLVVSDEIVREYHRVLRRPRFGLPGDRHLLRLEAYQDIPVITARTFLDQLGDDVARQKS